MSGPRDQYGLPVVAHRATRTVLAVGCVGGARAVGVSLPWSFAGCVPGAFIASKLWTYARHPDWLGPWSLGDAACDLGWQAGAIPIVSAIRGDWRLALPAGAAWVVWLKLVERRCIP